MLVGWGQRKRKWVALWADGWWREGKGGVHIVQGLHWVTVGRLTNADGLQRLLQLLRRLHQLWLRLLLRPSQKKMMWLQRQHLQQRLQQQLLLRLLLRLRPRLKKP
jgi:hypothetical protein